MHDAEIEIIGGIASGAAAGVATNIAVLGIAGLMISTFLDGVGKGGVESQINDVIDIHINLMRNQTI